MRSFPRLADLALLRELEASDRLALEEAGKVQQVREGEQVIAEGQQHDVLWVALEGRFRVSRGEDTLSELGVGQLFGEMEMLNPPYSTASVTALSEGTLWRLTRAEFRAFLASHPKAGRALMKLLTGTFAARSRRD